MVFIPRAPRDSGTEKISGSLKSSVATAGFYRSSGRMEVDDRQNSHVERYLLYRLGKDVLLKMVFE